MISDVLHEAVSELDRYLTEPVFNDCYKGRIREQIIKLRDDALYIMWILDTPPGGRVPAKASALAAIAERRRNEHAERRRLAAENQHRGEGTIA